MPHGLAVIVAIMGAEIQKNQSAAGSENPGGLSHDTRWHRHQMENKDEKGHINRRAPERDSLQFTPVQGHIGVCCQTSSGCGQHLWFPVNARHRSCHRCHALHEPTRAAPKVCHVGPGQKGRDGDQVEPCSKEMRANFVPLPGFRPEEGSSSFVAFSKNDLRSLSVFLSSERGL